MDASIPSVIGLLIGFPLGIAINAVFLRIAVKLVMKFDPPFSRACWAALVATVTTFIVGWLIGFAFGYFTGSPPDVAGFISLSFVTSFLVYAGTYGAMVTHPESSQSIGFGKGVMVSLVVNATYFVILLVFYVIYTRSLR